MRLSRLYHIALVPHCYVRLGADSGVNVSSVYAGDVGRLRTRSRSLQALNESAREIALEDAAEAARHRKVAVNYRMLAAFATDDELSSAYRKAGERLRGIGGRGGTSGASLQRKPLTDNSQQKASAGIPAEAFAGKWHEAGTGNQGARH